MEDPTNRYTTPIRPWRRRAPRRLDRAATERTDADRSPTPATGACLAPAAGRSRTKRLADLRRDPPARRAAGSSPPGRSASTCPDLEWGQLWPILLIGVGAWIVLGATRRTARRWSSHAPRRGLDPGRRICDRSRLAGRLAPRGSPRSTPRSAGWQPRTRRSRWPTGAPSASSSTASTRNRPVPPGARSYLRRRAISTTTRASASRSSSSPLHRPHPAPSPSSSPTAAPTRSSFTRVGRIAIPFAERRRARSRSSGWPATRAACSSRSATRRTARETYGAGRYLVDAAKSADLGGDPATGTLIVDFNFAFQPSCAFDPRWACPLAPPENRLDIADPCRRAPRTH